MHTDHRSVQTFSDPGDGKGGSIGCEHAFLLHDAHQLFEDCLLDLHLLQRNFNDQVTVRADAVQTCGDLAHDLVSLLLCDHLFAHQEIHVLLDLGLAALSVLFLNIAETNFIAVCHSECLCNTGTHGSRTDNTYFHRAYPP